MKKFLSLLFICICALSLIACNTIAASISTQNNSSVVENKFADIKVGFICLHDENSTYDNNFISAAKQACAQLGIPNKNIIFKLNTPEDNTCYEAALDLVDNGCSFIFGDSFSFEDYLVQAAQENPNVQFAHATGTKAHTEGLSNYANAFASIYEGRYLAGVAAGLKLNEMIDAGKITADQAVMGYVGAYTYAEVISGYTSFYLGAKSVCPTVTMKVQFTGSWYDQTLEAEAATALINDGCVLISQHADSMGAPVVCETMGIPNVSYNGSTFTACPTSFMISSRIDWTPYFVYAITQVANNEDIMTDWVGTIENGSVTLTELNDNVCASGTREILTNIQEKLISGELHVFDTSTFTVNGQIITSYIADVDTDSNYTGDTEVISDSYFHESEYRSAPYFDLRIDGIEILNEKY